MAQETAPARDALMTTELVPEQILPKVLTTFGLTAVYVFIICWITGSSVMATGGWQAIPFWVLGILTFVSVALVPPFAEPIATPPFICFPHREQLVMSTRGVIVREP